ncbi:MAG: GtrA family protein [Bacilli bacterium]|nr:GtrA family protein [Bacilli bacterium]
MMKLLKKYKEVIMYLIFGVLTTVISLLVFFVLTHTILSSNDALQLQIANILSWIAGVTFAYITNRKYVFESKNKNKLKEVSKFVSARVTTLLMDMFIMFLGVTILHFNDMISKIISQVVVIIANYIFSKLLVFNKQKD